MEKFEIRFKKSVEKDLSAFPKHDIKRILDRIRSLALDPRGSGCEKLSGLDQYRIRQGKYRIVYTIDDNVLVVEVVRVAHRKEVYR